MSSMSEMKHDLSERKDTLKDDIKQQTAAKKREVKHAVKEVTAKVQAAAPKASIISGVGDKISAAASSASAMLPTSITSAASNLTDKAAELKDAALHSSVVESYQADGVLAAAKTAASGSLAMGQQLKDKVMGASASSVEGEKKKRRRRRGGRSHGARKLKLRELPEKAGESIVDSLGDKAQEIKAIALEDPGLIGNIRNKASGALGAASGMVSGATSKATGLVSGAASSATGLVSGAASSATGLVSGAASSATGLVSGATSSVSGAASAVTSKIAAAASGATSLVSGKFSDLKGNLTDIKDETLKANHLERKDNNSSSSSSSSSSKPILDRKAELPSLGTPMSPEVSVTQSADGPMVVNVADQSSLKDKLLFGVNSAVDFVKDKLDNASMNADDDSASSNDATVLEKAKKQMLDMKDKVGEKLQ